MIPLIFLFSNFYQQYLFNELVKQSKMITTTPIIKGTSDLTYIFIYLPKYIYLDRCNEWKSQLRLIFNKVVTILTQNWTRTGLGENRFVDHFLSRSHNSPLHLKKKRQINRTFSQISLHSGVYQSLYQVQKERTFVHRNKRKYGASINASLCIGQAIFQRETIS